MDSIFSVRYFDGNDYVEHKQRCLGYGIESIASKMSREFRTDVEIWHYPYYGDKIKLCSILYKNQRI
jgi:hypothetical protein